MRRIAIPLRERLIVGDPMGHELKLEYKAEAT
jgi:hypothetical protein